MAFESARRVVTVSTTTTLLPCCKYPTHLTANAGRARGRPLFRGLSNSTAAVRRGSPSSANTCTSTPSTPGRSTETANPGTGGDQADAAVPSATGKVVPCLRSDRHVDFNRSVTIDEGNGVIDCGKDAAIEKPGHRRIPRPPSKLRHGWVRLRGGLKWSRSGIVTLPSIHWSADNPPRSAGGVSESMPRPLRGGGPRLRFFGRAEGEANRARLVPVISTAGASPGRPPARSRPAAPPRRCTTAAGSSRPSRRPARPAGRPGRSPRRRRGCPGRA